MEWKELLHISLTDNFSLNIELGIVFLIVLVVIGIIVVIFRWLWGKDGLPIFETELNIPLGGIGHIKIKSNQEVKQIAYKAWAELSTRKVGLLFDAENDVITEVYSSWYQLFQEIRTLIKEVPSNHMKNNSTRKLVDILVKTLNEGLRPHLTKWQARFKRWYETEIQKPSNKNKSPQEIQEKFPRYKELTDELLAINQKLLSYINELKKLIS